MYSRTIVRAAAGFGLAALVGGEAGCSALRRRSEGGPASFRRVSPGVAFEILHDTPEYLLVLDLRSAEEFRGPLGHLRGAHNLPLETLAARIFEVAGHRDRTLLVYCGDQACAESGMSVLLSHGFDGATLIEGGIEAWVGGGFGTVGSRIPDPAPGETRPLETQATPTLLSDSAEAEAGMPPPPPPMPDRGTAYLRLADGSVILPPRRPMDYHVVGRLVAGRFVPDGGVTGEGEPCEVLQRRETEATPAWLELSTGVAYPDQTERQPLEPFVRGCIGGDGNFRPTERALQGK